MGVLHERTWKNLFGHRWERVKEVDGRAVVRVDGLKLKSGRSLSYVRYRQGRRQREVLSSRWIWGRTRMLQERYDERSRRISGNGLLRRMTGFGIRPGGRLRFNSDADTPARTKALMPIVAEKRGQAIEIDIDGQLFVAEPGESARPVQED